MTSNEKDPQNEIKIKSKLKSLNFYSELERYLKRYHPREFGPIMASLILKVIKDRNLWGAYPPHFLVHAIEANCGYYSPPQNREINEQRINQIMSHYIEYYDPYLQYELQEKMSLETTLIAMARQQFPYQSSPDLKRLSRSLLLFLESESLTNIRNVFYETYGLSIRDWIYLGYHLSADTIMNDQPLLHPDFYENFSVNHISNNAIFPFLELSSLTVEKAGELYRKIRKDVPQYLHIFIRSIFHEYPLIGYEDKNYLAVHPGLFFNNIQNGLYKLCEELDHDFFHSCFGDAFEEYVGRLLHDQVNSIKILEESEIQNISPGRTCDYLVELQDCILLVECKSTKYSATLLTKNAIAGDNSTGKIANGYEQIYSTAKRVYGGEFSSAISAEEKPLYGLTITYGDLRFANSAYYYQNFIEPRMDLDEGNHWPKPLATNPQVVSISTLEDMINVANQKTLSMRVLFEEKESREYVEVGDWPAFIRTYFDETMEWGPPIQIQIIDQFKKDFE